MGFCECDPMDYIPLDADLRDEASIFQTLTMMSALPPKRY